MLPYAGQRLVGIEPERSHRRRARHTLCLQRHLDEFPDASVFDVLECGDLVGEAAVCHGAHGRESTPKATW